MRDPEVAGARRAPVLTCGEDDRYESTYLHRPLRRPPRRRRRRRRQRRIRDPQVAGARRAAVLTRGEDDRYESTCLRRPFGAHPDDAAASVEYAIPKLLERAGPPS